MAILRKLETSSLRTRSRLGMRPSYLAPEPPTGSVGGVDGEQRDVRAHGLLGGVDAVDLAAHLVEVEAERGGAADGHGGGDGPARDHLAARIAGRVIADGAAHGVERGGGQLGAAR